MQKGGFAAGGVMRSDPRQAKNMHVLLVDLGNELRGGQIQVFYLARALMRRDDIAPVVACPRGSALALLLEREGIPLLPLPGRAPFNPLVLFTVERALRRHAFRIIHTHDANAATGTRCG